MENMKFLKEYKNLDGKTVKIYDFPCTIHYHDDGYWIVSVGDIINYDPHCEWEAHEDSLEKALLDLGKRLLKYKIGYLQAIFEWNK